MCTVQHGVRYSVGYLLQCLLSGFLGWRRGDGGGGMAVGAGGMAVSPIRWQVANAPLSCRRGLEMLFFNQIKESPFRFQPTARAPPVRSVQNCVDVVRKASSGEAHYVST